MKQYNVTLSSVCVSSLPLRSLSSEFIQLHSRDEILIPTKHESFQTILDIGCEWHSYETDDGTYNTKSLVCFMRRWSFTSAS